MMVKIELNSSFSLARTENHRGGIRWHMQMSKRTETIEIENYTFRIHEVSLLEYTVKLEVTTDAQSVLESKTVISKARPGKNYLYFIRNGIFCTHQRSLAARCNKRIF
jgi:hypothetical protein